MATINRYTRGIENSLEQYVPLPFDTMFKAGQATQARYDQSVADDAATQTGLASIEARSPAYRQYVDKTISGYRDSMTNLIKKYNGRLDDPEFKRQAKQMQTQVANDPAFQTIKLGNEAIKQSQGLEAQLKAQGKLFISDLPNFKGTDENGRLIAYSGAPQAVNTLDEWTKSGAIAHQSTEEVGNTITNKNNLNRWKQAIQGDVAGQTKLMQAYMQQGMSQQQASQAVKSSVQGLINQYGVESKLNTGLMGLQQSAYQFNVSRADRLREAAAERANRLEIAKLKATKRAGVADDGSALPSVRQDNREFSTNTSTGSQFVVPFGASTLNKPEPIGKGNSVNFQGGFFRQTNSTSGKNMSYNGNLSKQTGSAKITNGTYEGVFNVPVDMKGRILTTSNKGEFIEANGKTYYRYKNADGKLEQKEARPSTMKVYKDNGTGSIYYQPTNAQEAMRAMGATGAYWDGRKTIAEQTGQKANQSANDSFKSIIGSFNFSDPNTVNTFRQLGSSRNIKGWADAPNETLIKHLTGIQKAMLEGDKIPAKDLNIWDNLLTDLQNMTNYEKFNRAEYNNQGKRSNIYNKIGGSANDNTLGQPSIDEILKAYNEEQED